MKKTKDTNKSQNHKMTFTDFDKLNLQSFAKNLYQIMEGGTASSIGEQGAYTISLNAEFGNGKNNIFKNVPTLYRGRKKSELLFGS